METLIQERTREKEINDESKCPKKEDTHAFNSPETLLSFCDCQRWQIIRIINWDLIECIDIYGRIQEFDMEKSIC